MRILAAILVSSTFGFAQAPAAASGSQAARDCAVNIQGNNNTGTVTCYGVDKMLADEISKLVATSKRDSKTLELILEKLRELRDEANRNAPGTSVTSINQQGGITAAEVSIGGPIPPHLRFTEEPAKDVDDGLLMPVHISTDRPIRGAIIGMILSGPMTVDVNAVNLEKSGARQIDEGSLQQGGVPVPNSLAFTINIPSVFSPGQELIVPVKSKLPVHVSQVFPLGN